MRRADRIIAICEAETAWIGAYLGALCPQIEVADIKRFFDLDRIKYVDGGGYDGRVERAERVDGRPLHLLYSVCLPIVDP